MQITLSFSLFCTPTDGYRFSETTRFVTMFIYYVDISVYTTKPLQYRHQRYLGQDNVNSGPIDLDILRVPHYSGCVCKERFNCSMLRLEHLNYTSAMNFLLYFQVGNFQQSQLKLIK